MSKPSRITILAALALASGQVRAAELSAAELAETLQQPGPHPVLIDIRPTAEYRRGSIPGAINIPGRVLPRKKMRFANGCILVSDGITDKVDPAALAAELAETGVSPVHHLRGGMAAWTELEDAATTRRVGAREGRGPRRITYRDLVRREGDTCLVDLRPAAERTIPEGHSCPVRGICSSQNFTYYPTLGKFHDDHADRGVADESATTPLIVLIGGEDTAHADAELEKLFIEGFHRSAILLGGGEILANEGRRGLKRKGGQSITLPETPSENP